jgi:fructokinase
VTAENSSEHSGIVTHVEDTIGAGDAFTAAVTIGYLRGMNLDDINEQANIIGAYVCSQQGGMPDMPESMKE